jgi:ABC-type phosphate transport system substrate-binding protein
MNQTTSIMKKVMIAAVITCLGAATASHAQTTTSSTDKAGTTKVQGQGTQTPTPKNEKRSDYQAADNRAQSTSETEHSQSMLFSKEALAIRRKNLTEPDTVMKSGSGSAPRNTKNHTGTTGNYRNVATQTSGIPSSE